MDTPAAGILIWCFIISYLSFQSAFFGLKLMAGMSWFGWVIYAIAHPPFSLTAGEGTHIAIIVVSVGIGLMIVLAGLGRGISRQKDYRSGLNTETTSSFSFKLPDWLKGSTPSGEEKLTREKRERETEEYRERLHRALNPPRRRR